MNHITLFEDFSGNIKWSGISTEEHQALEKILKDGYYNDEEIDMFEDLVYKYRKFNWIPLHNRNISMKRLSFESTAMNNTRFNFLIVKKEDDWFLVQFKITFITDYREPTKYSTVFRCSEMEGVEQLFHELFDLSLDDFSRHPMFHI